MKIQLFVDFRENIVHKNNEYKTNIYNKTFIYFVFYIKITLSINWAVVLG